MDNNKTNAPESLNDPHQKPCGKSRCVFWSGLLVTGLILSGSAFMWFPMLFPNIASMGDLKSKVENLESKMAHMPQGSELNQKIQTQIEESQNQNAQVLSPQIQEVYWALTMDRLVDEGRPFDHALGMLEKATHHQFSDNLKEISKVGMPSIQFLRRTFMNLMAHKAQLNQEEQKKASGHSRLRLMIEGWLSKIVTIESTPPLPKNYEDILIAFNQNDLQKALDILKANPDPLLDKWETHARARLLGMQEIEAFRNQLFHEKEHSSSGDAILTPNSQPQNP